MSLRIHGVMHLICYLGYAQRIAKLFWQSRGTKAGEFACRNQRSSYGNKTARIKPSSTAGISQYVSSTQLR